MAYPPAQSVDRAGDGVTVPAGRKRPLGPDNGIGNQDLRQPASGEDPPEQAAARGRKAQTL